MMPFSLTGKNVSPLGEQEDMPLTMLAGAADQLVFGAAPAASGNGPLLNASLGHITHAYRLMPIGAGAQTPGGNVVFLARISQISLSRGCRSRRIWGHCGHNTSTIGGQIL